MAGPVVVKNASCKLTFGATVIDISAYVTAVEPSSESETIDLGTFANPKATDTGRITDGVTISCLWAPELHAALAPYVNAEGTLEFKYVTSDTKAVRAGVKYGTLPWGAFSIGERVEADLVLAVLDQVAYN